MGWYFRKSLGLGNGLRLNLSKSGIGVSTGVPGLRVGVNPRGQQYIQCGRGGIYYRKVFGNGGTHSTSYGQRQSPYGQGKTPSIPNGTPVGPTVASGNVAQMFDSSAVDLLSEIKEKNRLLRICPWFGTIATVAVVIAASLGAPIIAVAVGIVGIVGTVWSWRLDRRRKTVELIYHLDPAFAGQYRQFQTAFQRLCAAQRIWVVEAVQATLDPRYSAGATSDVQRRAVRLYFSLPPFVKSNIKPPMLPAGRKKIYFLPDTILIFEGDTIGAVAYTDLHAMSATTRFIEGGNQWPPSDARQVDRTWKYVNKNGTPDRRFANNREIPVMEYGNLRLTSNSGLDIHLQVSATGAAAVFESALHAMASHCASIPIHNAAIVSISHHIQTPFQPPPTSSGSRWAEI